MLLRNIPVDYLVKKKNNDIKIKLQKSWKWIQSLLQVRVMGAQKFGTIIVWVINILW